MLLHYLTVLSRVLHILVVWQWTHAYEFTLGGTRLACHANVPYQWQVYDNKNAPRRNQVCALTLRVHGWRLAFQVNVTCWCWFQLAWHSCVSMLPQCHVLLIQSYLRDISLCVSSPVLLHSPITPRSHTDDGFCLRDTRAWLSMLPQYHVLIIQSYLRDMSFRGQCCAFTLAYYTVSHTDDGFCLRDTPTCAVRSAVTPMSRANHLIIFAWHQPLREQSCAFTLACYANCHILMMVSACVTLLHVQYILLLRQCHVLII